MRRKLKIAKYHDLLKIKTKENKEDLVNISKMLSECFCEYKKKDMYPYVGNDLWVRKEVALKLNKALKRLKKNSPELTFKIVYGYRHPEIQELYFYERKKIIKSKNPDLDEESLNELVNIMTAYPYTAGHPTGGAIDITICNKAGRNIDMGTEISDFSNLDKVKTFYSGLTIKQKTNRLLLHNLMIKEGFAPYYEEWWHFSYGDKEWAWFYNKNYAIYGKKKLKIKKT